MGRSVGFRDPHCSVQFHRSVMSNFLWSHGLQHTRPPYPSPTPGACSNSCLLSRWCHPTISSSVVPFSSRLQSFPASGSFPMSQFFSSGGQNIGISASASVLPVNIQDWFLWGLTGWSPCSPRDSQKSLLQHHSLKFTDPHCSCPKSPKCLTSNWLKPGLWSLCSDHLLCFKSSPLQCFCLENPMDGGAWRATVHRTTKNRTWLSERADTEEAPSSAF